MLIHGGFWRARYHLRLEDQLVADLAGRGWAAWNLEYRRLGWRSRGGWPATFEDVAAGIDLLGRLDESLDLARVIAIGHSAGGHLALWAAARRGLPAAAPGSDPRIRLAGAVSQAGVVDLREAARLGLSRRAAESLLGGSPIKLPARYDLASPIERLPLGVPQLRRPRRSRRRRPDLDRARLRRTRGGRGRPLRARRAPGRRPRRASRTGQRRLACRDRLARAAVSERERAAQLDAEDPLAGFRERFVIEDPELIYLDGNSLGRLPRATRDRTNALLDQWGGELVRGWDEWIELPERVGDLIGAAVLGAKPGEVLVSDSTTVNLFKLAGALLTENPGPDRRRRGRLPHEPLRARRAGRVIRPARCTSPARAWPTS